MSGIQGLEQRAPRRHVRRSVSCHCRSCTQERGDMIARKLSIAAPFGQRGEIGGRRFQRGRGRAGAFCIGSMANRAVLGEHLFPRGGGSPLDRNFFDDGDWFFLGICETSGEKQRSKCSEVTNGHNLLRKWTSLARKLSSGERPIGKTVALFLGGYYLTEASRLLVCLGSYRLHGRRVQVSVKKIVDAVPSVQQHVFAAEVVKFTGVDHEGNEVALVFF